MVAYVDAAWARTYVYRQCKSSTQSKHNHNKWEIYKHETKTSNWFFSTNFNMRLLKFSFIWSTIFFSLSSFSAFNTFGTIISCVPVHSLSMEWRFRFERFSFCFYFSRYSRCWILCATKMQFKHNFYNTETYYLFIENLYAFECVFVSLLHLSLPPRCVSCDSFVYEFLFLPRTSRKRKANHANCVCFFLFSYFFNRTYNAVKYLWLNTKNERWSRM